MSAPIVSEAQLPASAATTIAHTRAAGSLVAPLFWLREIIDRRDLLYMLVVRDIKLKYKQSLMGVLWAALMPGLIVMAAVVVKYVFASIAGTALRKEDLVNVAVRSVPWAFVVASVRFATNSLISNASLVTKIYMPRVIFPMAAVLSQAVDLAVAAVVVTLFLVFAGVHFHAAMLAIPALVAVLLVFVTGVAILVSAAALFYRDVKYIVEVVLTYAIFFTPVFYDSHALGRWAEVLLLNPVAPILDAIGAAATGGAGPGLAWILYSVGVSTCVFVGALAFFKRVEPFFAESV